MTETLHFSLIGFEDLKTSPRSGTFEATLADGTVATLTNVDIAYLVRDAYTEATLPTSGVATGQLARVTDKGNDLRLWNGSAWVSVTKITTRGDLVYGATGGVPTRLALGAAGRLLSSDGTDVAWGQGPLTTTGDLLIGATAGTPTRLAIGSTDQVLGVSGGTAAWLERPRVLDRATVAIDVVNTVSETALYSVTVSGGTLATDRALRLTLLGDVLNNTGVAQTIRVRGKYGATTFFDSGISDSVGASATRRAMRIQIDLHARGATNAQRAFVKERITDLVVGGAGINRDGGSIADIAEDSTANKAFSVTVELGAASVNLSVRFMSARLEWLP